MHSSRTFRRHFVAPFAVMGALALGACAVDDTGGAADTAAQATAQPPASPAPAPVDSAPQLTDISVEVDLATRKLHLMQNGQHVAEYGVAIGSEKWPTQTGEWTIKQVVWNPEWVPPTDESWTEDKEPKDPGDPDNPLGRVQLVYDLPRTIHGTNQPASIGKAVSHGSIRMRNADAIALAKRVMEAAGVPRDEAWYAEVASKRTTKEIIDLPKQVPITVK